MAVCTIAIAGLAFAQWGVSAKQTDITDRQTRILELQQRSWVGVEKIIASRELKAGVPLQASLIWKNLGGTPAFHVKCDAGICRMEKDKEFVATYETGSLPADAQENEDLSGNNTLFPEVVYPSPVTSLAMDENGELKAEIERGDQVVYAYGKVIYADALDRTHHTHFCVRFVQNDGRWKWVMHDTYNDAD